MTDESQYICGCTRIGIESGLRSRILEVQVLSPAPYIKTVSATYKLTSVLGTDKLFLSVLYILECSSVGQSARLIIARSTVQTCPFQPNIWMQFSLVERQIWDLEAGGSSPFIQTTGRHAATALSRARESCVLHKTNRKE